MCYWLKEESIEEVDLNLVISERDGRVRVRRR